MQYNKMQTLSEVLYALFSIACLDYIKHNKIYKILQLKMSYLQVKCAAILKMLRKLTLKVFLVHLHQAKSYYTLFSYGGKR